MCTWKILSSLKRSAHAHERNIANNNFPNVYILHYTYTIKWYPGGVCSPFVLLINTISQTALAAVLLD